LRMQRRMQCCTRDASWQHNSSFSCAPKMCTVLFYNSQSMCGSSHKKL
jgi:hypothetical protein